jgi:hypothetical protein
MPTAATRVLDTPELLEAILLHLPLRDLLHSQRVSCQFQATVTSSPSIQRALFFRANRRKFGPQEWDINPLLREAFLPWFLYPKSEMDLPKFETFEFLDWNSSEQKQIAYARPEASWRRMFFIQPPPQKLTVKQYHNSMGGDSEAAGELLFDADENDGVRMDVLYDIPFSFFCIQIVSSFGLQVHFPRPGNAEAPSMTLKLRYVKQCCRRAPKGRPRLQSLADKKWHFMDIKYKAPPHPGYPPRIGWSWSSDMTLDRGGVSPQELKEWKIGRHPDALSNDSGNFEEEEL